MFFRCDHTHGCVEMNDDTTTVRSGLYMWILLLIIDKHKSLY